MTTNQEDNMDITNDELRLLTRVLSIHRSSMRRKLSRFPTGSREYINTVGEIQETQDLASKLQALDVERLSA